MENFPPVLPWKEPCLEEGFGFYLAEKDTYTHAYTQTHHVLKLYWKHVSSPYWLCGGDPLDPSSPLTPATLAPWSLSKGNVKFVC